MPDLPDFGLAPPPFDAATALTQLRRSLRDLRLAERGAGFELRGKRVAELTIDGPAIAASTARRLALTPEWDRTRIRNAAEQRQWLAALRQRLERWERDE